MVPSCELATSTKHNGQRHATLGNKGRSVASVERVWGCTEEDAVQAMARARVGGAFTQARFEHWLLRYQFL